MIWKGKCNHCEVKFRSNGENNYIQAIKRHYASEHKELFWQMKKEQLDFQNELNELMARMPSHMTIEFRHISILFTRLAEKIKEE